MSNAADLPVTPEHCELVAEWEGDGVEGTIDIYTLKDRYYAFFAEQPYQVPMHDLMTIGELPEWLVEEVTKREDQHGEFPYFGIITHETCRYFILRKALESRDSIRLLEFNEIWELFRGTLIRLRPDLETYDVQMWHKVFCAQWWELKPQLEVSR